jgi:hypothetical protein
MRAHEAAELIKSQTLKRLIGEATELVAITSAAYGTARYNERQNKKRRS